jgi:broad specificity phosphatase PhoE
MTRTYLIRHGKPAVAWGGDDEDPGLDDKGREQARVVATRLLALPNADRPAMVVSSPLRRCRETAQPLADALGVAVEIDAGVGEIPTPSTLSVAERPRWLREAFAGRWSEIAGDTDYDTWRRSAAAAASRRPGAAIFSHFVAINAAVSVITGDDQVVAFRPDHASVTILDVAGGQLSLVALGDEAETSVL